MRALFFPSYLGGGFGHIGRCLTLAEALQKQGWQTGFVTGGRHTGRVRRISRDVFVPRRPRSVLRRSESGGPGPAYLFLSGLAYQVVRDGLVSPRIVRACVAEQLRFVRRFSPDVLISDAWLLGGLLSALSGVPLVQITRANLHPAGPPLIWWRDLPPELQPPDPRPIFNPLLESWNLPPIDRAEDLLRGHLYLIPSIPDLDPLPEGREDTYYLGPFVRRSGGEVPDWLQGLGSRPLVYITTGGGAGSQDRAGFYRSLIDAFRTEKGLDLVISTGGKVPPKEFGPLPTHVRVENWVPGPEVIARSSLVVYSGGYGTSMELVHAGVPGLVIPFHSEQESNARRLESAGAVRVLPPASSGLVPVWHDGPAGRFSVLVHPSADLTGVQIKDKILCALADESMRVAARRLQSLSTAYGGVQDAVVLMEEKLPQIQPDVEPGWESLSWWQKLALF